MIADLTPQEQVDYVNDIQKRVAAETLALEDDGTITLAADAYSYALPSDLIELEAVYNGETKLYAYDESALLSSLSGSGVGNLIGPQGYVVVGQTLYVLPTPAQAGTLTLVYYKRPATFASNSALAVSGEEEDVAEFLLDAYLALDTGETEVGMAGIAAYEADVLRVRRSNRARAGVTARRPARGVDSWV